MAEGTGGMDINRLIGLMGIMIVVMVVVAAAGGLYLFVISPLMEGSRDSAEPLSAGYYSSGYTTPHPTAKSGAVSQGSGSSAFGSVTKVDSFLPDDPDYYGPEITSSEQPPYEPHLQNLEQIYAENGILLNYMALSYNVNVPKGPLLISFRVDPDTGYSEDYDDGGVNPYLTYMYMRVYDLGTGDLVADEGYMKEYSSETEKEIFICREGEFRIDIYGRMVTVDFTVSTGGV